MDNDEYYTIKEVSKLLKVAYLTVYRWIKEGRLESFRVGKKYMVKKSSMEALIEKSKVGVDSNK